MAPSTRQSIVEVWIFNPLRKDFLSRVKNLTLYSKIFLLIGAFSLLKIVETFSKLTPGAPHLSKEEADITNHMLVKLLALTKFFGVVNSMDFRNVYII